MRLGPIKLLDSALCLHVWSATASLRAYDESPGVFLSSIAERNHSACSVSERAKLCARCLPLVFLAACASERVTPVYDPAGAIRRLDYDTDRDGRVDMRAYLENGRTMRIEADGNGDGIVDRWEYYRTDGQLDRLGTSSESDGVEDTWVVQRGDEMRVDISTRRDGVADRHEFHDKGVLVRSEQDTNGDGRIDQWQRFDGGKLRELLLDTSQASGRPDRRLVYANDGSVQSVDSDVSPK